MTTLGLSIKTVVEGVVVVVAPVHDMNILLVPFPWSTIEGMEKDASDPESCQMSPGGVL